MSARVEFRSTNFSYGTTAVLKDFDLTIPASSYVCLVGQSGSGKTTILRLIAGFETPSAGDISIECPSSTNPIVQVVFQDYYNSLLPWFTVATNVRLGIRPGEEQASLRIQEVLADMDLPKVNKMFPRELSGGMQQRVALARALIADPEVLLLDEPLGSLDTLTKLDLQDQLQRIWQARGLTVIHVTHDLDEACYLADSIVVVRKEQRPVVVQSDICRPRHRLKTREDEQFLTLRRALFEELGYV